MVAELKSVRGRQGVMGSELGGLGIVGEGEGTSEVVEGVKNVRKEDDRGDASGGVEEMVESLWEVMEGAGYYAGKAGGNGEGVERR